MGRPESATRGRRDRAELGVAKILRACAHLDQGRLEEVLRVTGEGPNDESILSESISLCARGLIFEREGNAAEADRCFETVLTKGAPLPVVLRESGRYFKRTGEYEKAYRCYSVLHNVEPQALHEFLEGLPSPEQSRYSPWTVKTHQAGQHWFLPPVKEALVAQLGTEGAAVALAEMVWGKPGWDVARMRLTGLRDFAKEHGLVYEELSSSMNVSLPSPPVFGTEPGDGVQARTRTFFFCVLADVVVSSKSNFLLTGDRALLDYQDDELRKIPLDLHVDPIVLAPAGDEVTVLIEERAASGEALEQAVPLVGVNTGNFGHWLLEFLPKVFACIDRPGFDSVPLVVDQPMPPQHREALQFFVGRDHPLIVLKRFEAVRVKRLWVPSMIAYVPLFPEPGSRYKYAPDALALDDEAFADLLARTQPMLEAIERRPGPKRIYLTRKDSQHRRLVNRPEVEEWFAAHGFEVFDFGDLPFMEQLALTRSADVMIAQDGSSIMTSFFARPGTRIGLLTNPYAEYNESYAHICRRLGQPYSILTGELVARDPDYTHRSQYRIKLDTLPPFLEQLLSDH